MNRRLFCASLAVLGLPLRPLWAGQSTVPVWGTWRNTIDGRYMAGLLQVNPGSGAVLVDEGHQLPLPGRAHGLAKGSDGSLWIAARRPGDWLIRWQPASGATQRLWFEPDVALNGHVCCAPQRHAIALTATNHETGEGSIKWYDEHTLDSQPAWPTHGIEPHAMLLLPSLPAVSTRPVLVVANGGLLQKPETGRARVPGSVVDSSLCAFDLETGNLLRRWALQDRHLSLRHLAFNTTTGELGVALQAHSDDMAVNHTSPLLAVLAQGKLSLVPGTAGFQGYAGDITACASGFAVAATQASRLLVVNGGQLTRVVDAPQVCALAQPAGQLLAGVQQMGSLSLELDNHWVSVQG